MTAVVLQDGNDINFLANVQKSVALSEIYFPKAVARLLEDAFTFVAFLGTKKTVSRLAPPVFFALSILEGH